MKYEHAKRFIKGPSQWNPFNETACFRVYKLLATLVFIVKHFPSSESS